MLVYSDPDHFSMSVHPQLVSDDFWCLCKVILTILQYLCILSLWVMILDACVKWPWPFSNVCASSVCEWQFLMLVWSDSNHFPMSVHPQEVSDDSWCLSEVTLTILQCLCILRKWVMILDACVKWPWPFCNVCASSASEQQSLMLVWSGPDHFAMFVHPQQVSEDSGCLCEVTLTMLQWLCILSEWVMILDACVKWLWPFFNVCASSGSEWWFLMLVWSEPDHLQCLCTVLSEWVIIVDACVKWTWPFCNVCAYSASEWWFLMLVWSEPDHFAMSVHPQQVSDDSGCLCEVWPCCNVCASSGCKWSFLMLVWSDLIILQCLCIISLWVIILDACVKWPWPCCNVCVSSASEWWFLLLVWSEPDHFAISVHPQDVSDDSWCLGEVSLTIVQCLCILRMWVMILDACLKWPWIFQCLCILRMWVMILDACVNDPDHFAMCVHLREWVMILDACVKWLWPFCDVCTSSASEWWFLMLVWSDPDHLQCLCILRKWVMIIDAVCMKWIWPFCNFCASSVCEWWFLILVWSDPDHVAMSVHPQRVSDDSWCLSEVTWTMFQCLCILSEWAMVLDACVKWPWPFCNVSASSECEWWFLMLMWSDPEFCNVCASSACEWWFVIHVWSDPDHFAISVHPQYVSDDSWCFVMWPWLLECLCILSLWVMILDTCLKWPYHFSMSVHPQRVSEHSWCLCELTLIILQCLCILRK